MPLDPEAYDTGRSFGHLAYKVDNIYDSCQRLMDAGVTINRPPRDGRMAFVKSPDNISIELLQEGDSLPLSEPWASMENTGAVGITLIYKGSAMAFQTHRFLMTVIITGFFYIALKLV